MLCSEIQIRDPYVVLLDGKYYLYGTTGNNCWGKGYGFDAYISDDLTHFDGPFPIFRPRPGFWADKNFWAPEMHFYRGGYYLFASFKADGVCRGTQILRADHPLGPFEEWSDGPVTPRDWECLDGTLYVDGDGKPYMVFCHEWVQIKDGTIAYLPLTDDLRAAAGPAVELFAASSAPWNNHDDPDGTHVTDGPFLYRTSGGKLLMLWSTFGKHGYAIGYCVSQSGGIEGPWVPAEQPLFDRDGGHGMLFTDKSGQLMLTIHSPNDTPNERAVFLPVTDTGDGLTPRA